MERKQAEMKQMREEMSKYMMQIDDQKAVIGKWRSSKSTLTFIFSKPTFPPSEKMERESQDALEELRNLRSFRAQTIKEKELELAKKGKTSWWGKFQSITHHHLKCCQQKKTAVLLFLKRRKDFSINWMFLSGRSTHCKSRLLIWRRTPIVNTMSNKTNFRVLKR